MTSHKRTSNIGNNMVSLRNMILLNGLAMLFLSSTLAFGQAPNIASLSPISGPVGTSVTITGTNFGSTQGTSTVTFNGVTAAPTSWSDSSIVVPVPTGANTGNVVVTVGGQSSHEAVVQSPGQVAFGTNSPSVTITPSAAGNTLIVLPGMSDGIAVVSVTDNVGNSWVQAPGAQATSAGDGFATDTWYCANCTAGVTTITAHLSASADFAGLIAYEVSGIVTSSPLELATHLSEGTVNGGNCTGPSVTTSSTDFLIAQGDADHGFSGVSIPWVFGGNEQDGYVLNAAPGTYQPVFQVGAGSTNCLVSIAAFKIATGTSGVASNSVFFQVGGGGTSGTPNIASLSPISGAIGTPVTITGTNFGSTQDTSTVTFNGVTAAPTSWSDSSIVVPAPSEAATGNVVVTVGGHSSSEAVVQSPGQVAFGTATPSITISPSAAGNTLILLPGIPVGMTVASVTDNIGNSWVQAPNAQATSAGDGFATDIWYCANCTRGVTTITAHLSASAGFAGLLLYEVSGLATTSPLELGANVSEAAVSGGNCVGPSVTTSSTDFLIAAGDADHGFSGVSIPWIFGGNEQDGYVLNAAPGTYQPVFQAGAGSTNCLVSIAAFKTVSTNFTVIVPPPPPSITTLSLNSGSVGTSVTITGANFGSVIGTSTVTFNGLTATPTSWSATSITASVPTGATTGNVVVSVGGQTSNGVTFTVSSSTPVITTLAPTSAPVAALITITGSGFGASQGTGSVSFNGTSASVARWTDTSILVFVPTGASPCLVAVSANGLLSNGVSFTVTAAPHIDSISPTSGSAGQLVAISGGGFGSTQGGSFVSFNGVVSSPSSWSDTSIQVPVSLYASSGNVVIAMLGVVSNAVPFTVPPSIISLSPSSGAIGASVTITGHDFGDSQPTGSSVKFNGTAAMISTWSANSITATVPSGASSGMVVANVGGTNTNGVPFTVVPSPTIVGVSPTNGIAGTQITITGFGFGITQGSGSLMLGSTYGVITSWGDTQIVANVAVGAKSGTAQVSQGSVPSNAVSFTVTTPTVTTASPNPAMPGTTITIAGSAFGASQGNGNVWLGSTYGIVSSWSDTQIVASVAASAKSGTAKVLQNGVWSDPVQFSVNSGTVPTTTMSPSMMNLIVGETRSIQALDSSGTPVAGLTWASSNTSIVNLSTDDPPILTAMAPGHAIITAGDGFADVFVSPGSSPVTGLPIGTIQWSVPGDGSGVTQILPAVPSPIGMADVFAVQASGNVEAVTSDGRMAWTANINPKNHLIPDFQGGFISEDLYSIRTIDGMTGQVHPAYTFTHTCVFTDVLNNSTQVDCSSLGDDGVMDLWGYPAIAVHPDGTIFAIDGDSIVGIDPTSGSAKFRVQLHGDSFNDYPNCHYCVGGIPLLATQPVVENSIVVAGDGYAYVAFSYLEESTDVATLTTFVEFHFAVQRIGPDGESSSIPIQDASFWENSVIAEGGNGGVGPTVTLIANADQGVSVVWVTQGPYSRDTQHETQLPEEEGEYHLTTISGGGVTSDTVLQKFPLVAFEPDLTGFTNASWIGELIPILQKEDGTYVGTLRSLDPETGETTEQAMVSFGPGGGLTTIANGNFQPLMATADGGVIAKAPDGSVVAFNTNQAPTANMASMPTQSWTGNTYQVGSLDSVVSTPVGLAGSFWALAGGNASGNGAAIQQVLTNQPQGNEEQLPDLANASCLPSLDSLFPLLTCGNINAIDLVTNASPDFIFQNYIQTFLPAAVDNNDNPNNGIMIFTGPGGAKQFSVTGSGQKLTITLRGVAKLGQGPFSVLTERFDPTNHVISVVTLKGHPLAGWRYFRVYSIGAHDVVVETGAYDQPGPGLKNYAGYYLSAGVVSRGWHDYLQFIEKDLNASQGTNLRQSLDAIPLRFTSNPNALFDGYWDYSGDFTNYILNNVCQSTSCN